MSTINTITTAISISDVGKFLRYWWRSYYDEGYMARIENDFPKDALNQEPEALWWGDNAPKAQHVLGKGWRAFRVYTRVNCEDMFSNWFLIIRDVEEWNCTWEWVHCTSYREWGTRVLNKYLYPSERSRWDRPNYNRTAWTLPLLGFEISSFDGALKPHVAYSVKDQQVLEEYKYGIDPYERPMNQVYGLACWIHSKVSYTDLGMKCSADTEDEWVEEDGETIFHAAEEYNGLPDDLAILVAHAILVMGDRHRAEALLKIRAFVRPYKDPVPTYEDCLGAASHYWDY